MRDKWMNIGFEEEELNPYLEPSADINDPTRIRKHKCYRCCCMVAVGTDLVGIYWKLWIVCTKEGLSTTRLLVGATWCWETLYPMQLIVNP